MIVYLIIVLCFTPLLILILFKNSKLKRKPLRPPGPQGLPILGNLHQFEANNTHVYLWKLSQKYGPIMSLKLGSVPTLVISSAKMAEQVMKTHGNIFTSRPKLLGLQTLSYNGFDVAFCPVITDYQREMKRISNVHLFGTKRVQSFRPIREDEVSRLVKKITEFASSEEVINLSEIMVFVSISFICRVAFGKRYEEGGLESRRLEKILNEAGALLMGFYLSDYIPSLGWFDKISGMISRLEKNFKELDSFYEELIEEHLNKSRNKSAMITEDILDILLKLKNEASSSVQLTLDHVKGMMTDIFIAGTDTATTFVIWIMTMLMKTPLTMKRVQAEIRASIGNKYFVEEEDLKNLPYFKAIIKETLRLCPIIPLIPREANESCMICGYEIQPKTLVFVNLWAIGRDPEYWDNPYEFSPERFLNSSIDFKGQDFGFIPFGSGRRICPGLSLTIATVESILANLLHSFDWELPHGMKKEDIHMDAKPGLIMFKKTPLTLIAKLRHT